MADPLDLAAREFPGAGILECNGYLSIVLARTEQVRLSLSVHRSQKGARWVAKLTVNGEAVAIVGQHDELGEVLRIGRNATQAIAEQLVAVLATQDGAQEKDHDV